MTESDIEWTQYEAAVGKNWERYRPRFERFAKGGWLSWNWAAFFGTFAWLRFRKLYAWSWPYLFVSTPVLLTLPVLLIGDSCEYELTYGPPDFLRWGIVGALVLGSIVPPLIADRIYFGRIRALVRASRTDAGAGGYWGALMLQAFLGVVLFAGSMGRFDDAIYRAMTSEGILLAASVKVPLAEYFADHAGKFPARIEDVAEPTSGKYVAGLSLGPDGTIKAVFGAGGRRLAGHSVSMLPSKKDGRIVEWSCHSEDLPNTCLPAACRRD
jgi:hypothetical protein